MEVIVGKRGTPQEYHCARSATTRSDWFRTERNMTLDRLSMYTVARLVEERIA